MYDLIRSLLGDRLIGVWLYYLYMNFLMVYKEFEKLKSLKYYVKREIQISRIFAERPMNHATL